MNNYKYSDIKKAYKKLGVGKNKIVFVESNLSCLGVYEIINKEAISEAHLRALRELVGDGGTIVVPTASFSLMNTNTPFDLKNTPSERGIFSEYVRQQKGVTRSFHPFGSYTALGRYAKDICHNVSRHAYGPETPMGRMINKDTLFISVGLRPATTCSTIHLVEMLAGVPYRYHREYMHPVTRRGKIAQEPFYMYVWYHQCNIQRNDKEALWKDFQLKHEVREAFIGRGKIYSYSMKEFYEYAMKAFRNNMYLLLKEIPAKRPYVEKM